MAGVPLSMSEVGGSRAVQLWPGWRGSNVTMFSLSSSSEMMKSETMSSSSPKSRSRISSSIGGCAKSSWEPQLATSDRAVASLLLWNGRGEAGIQHEQASLAHPRQFEQTSCGCLLEIRFPQQHTRGSKSPSHLVRESFLCHFRVGRNGEGQRCSTQFWRTTRCYLCAWTVVGC